MSKKNVINFTSKERLIEKARFYIDSVEDFLEDRKNAVPLLLKALRLADQHLRLEIILLLGSFAKQEVAEPLYQIMMDLSEDEDMRRDASIQLSVIFSFLKNPQPLIDKLLENIKDPDPVIRLNAAFALGWEGNAQAAIALIELLYDPDSRVQQTAVNALSNLRDDRILNLMLERLEHGPLDQKRSILFNLWRFYSKRKEVISIYLKYLEHENDKLRFDALVLLSTITEPETHIEAYRKCLKDDVARIRALALKKLKDASTRDLLELKAEIETLLSDPNMEVKQAALKVLKKMKG
jgi:HEAT repeat protein